MQGPTARYYLAKESMEDIPLNGIPPLRAQATLQSWRQKEWKIKMGWRTPGEQGPLNQLRKVYKNSQWLKQQEQGLPGLFPVLGICIIDFRFVFLLDIDWVNERVSDSCAWSWSSFPFFSVCLSSLSVMVVAYEVLFLCNLIKCFYLFIYL